jgi:hypothetical protein
MPTRFLDIPVTADADAIEQDVHDALSAEFPGWVPAAGNLETFMIKALAQIAADLADVAGAVPAAIFAEFGRKIVNVPQLLAAPALATSTWTMVDDAGYTIPQGTLVSIAATGDELYAFAVAFDVMVPAGSTATDAGEVVLQASLPGQAANELVADPQLIESLAYVDSIVLVGATGGGTDAEPDVDYLDRLAAEMTLLTARPILPRDAEVLARRISAVSRALALDGYNPDDDTYDNERMVAVAVVDADGAALPSPDKDEVDALLQSERELNFVFNVIDPTANSIDVDAEVTVVAGYSTSDVEAAVIEAIGTWLSPAAWGTTRDSAGTILFAHEWQDEDTVRLNDLIGLVDRVPGVAYVTSVTLCLTGGSLTAADVSLDGPAALTEPGAITCTATTP